MDNILEVRGLKMHFGGVKAVDELSFDVHRHELLGVIGPNGSGKTTMFNALTGVYKPTDGKVTFNGIDITGKPLDSMVNYGIARTFQNLRVFKAMTVLDNIMIGNSKNIHTKDLVLISSLLSLMGYAITGDSQPTKMLVSNAFRDVYAQKKIDCGVLSRTLDIAGFGEGIFPWTVGGTYFATLFNVSVGRYWYLVFFYYFAIAFNVHTVGRLKSKRYSL